MSAVYQEDNFKGRVALAAPLSQVLDPYADILAAPDHKDNR